MPHVPKDDDDVRRPGVRGGVAEKQEAAEEVAAEMRERQSEDPEGE